MTYQPVFVAHWWNELRADGVWKTDPRGQTVTLYRFLRDLRVIGVTVPAGSPLVASAGTWLLPDRDRVDDGRAVYPFDVGRFGTDGGDVLALWPSIRRNTGPERHWSEGRVGAQRLSWSFRPWTGRSRPAGFHPPAEHEDAHFVAVPGW